jgi:hypothetical protein
MKTYPLTPSPLILMRTKYRLSEEEGARRLGVTVEQLRTLELHSQQVPAGVLDVVDLLWGPPPIYIQTTIWEALQELGRLDAQAAIEQGEGVRHA